MLKKKKHDVSIFTFLMLLPSPNDHHFLVSVNNVRLNEYSTTILTAGYISKEIENALHEARWCKSSKFMPSFIFWNEIYFVNHFSVNCTFPLTQSAFILPSLKNQYPVGSRKNQVCGYVPKSHIDKIILNQYAII